MKAYVVADALLKLRVKCLPTIGAKLARGTFAVTFFLATLAALEMEGVRLEDL
jgi:hypothetical protein